MCMYVCLHMYLYIYLYVCLTMHVCICVYVVCACMCVCVLYYPCFTSTSASLLYYLQRQTELFSLYHSASNLLNTNKRKLFFPGKNIAVYPDIFGKSFSTHNGKF